jgi:hypothetical protein
MYRHYNPNFVTLQAIANHILHKNSLSLLVLFEQIQLLLIQLRASKQTNKTPLIKKALSGIILSFRKRTNRFYINIFL